MQAIVPLAFMAPIAISCAEMMDAQLVVRMDMTRAVGVCQGQHVIVLRHQATKSSYPVSEIIVKGQL